MINVLQILCGILLTAIIYLVYALRKVQTNLIDKSEALHSIDQELHEMKVLLAQTKTELDRYKTKYQPIISLDEVIEQRQQELELIESDLSILGEKYQSNLEIYNSLAREIELYQNELDIREFGIYKPEFSFETSEEYKEKLDVNYQKQRECLKNGIAIICREPWTVNGSTSEGKKLTNKYSKLMLSGFNGACDALIANVRWNNATRTKEKILKAFDSINKLGESATIQITNSFLLLKLEQMALTHEYENKKREEKEEQRRIREQMREEERVQRELERAQREADEDEKQYKKALRKAQEDLKVASTDDLNRLTEQIKLLETRLEEAHQRKERAISMAQLTKVGHIYIISNIGSFGEDVFKIGMTRRLEPLDRVRELGDASVPFQFDVHAIIYSDNAPQLEYDLHKRFEDKRVNRVNGRKEFFKVSLSEIQDYIKTHKGADIELTKIAEAKEYRETLTMLNEILRQEDEKLEAVAKYPRSLN